MANVVQKKEKDRLERITAFTAMFGSQEHEVHRRFFQQLNFTADKPQKGRRKHHTAERIEHYIRIIRGWESRLS